MSRNYLALDGLPFFGGFGGGFPFFGAGTDMARRIDASNSAALIRKPSGVPDLAVIRCPSVDIIAAYAGGEQ